MNTQTQTLISEIAEKIKTADSKKNLFFAVRNDENYRNDYLAIRDELPALVGDDGNFYAIRIIDEKDIERYLGYWKENDNQTPTTKKRSVCVYLTKNEGEIDSLQTAINGENEFFVVG